MCWRGSFMSACCNNMWGMGNQFQCVSYPEDTAVIRPMFPLKSGWRWVRVTELCQAFSPWRLHKVYYRKVPPPHTHTQPPSLRAVGKPTVVMAAIMKHHTSARALVSDQLGSRPLRCCQRPQPRRLCWRLMAFHWLYECPPGFMFLSCG